MKRSIFTILFFCIIGTSFGLDITTNTTFNSIGYYVNNIQTVFSDRISVNVSFRIQNGTWRQGLMPSVITFNNQKTIAGSVVQLSENTTYEIKITIIDSAAGNTPTTFTTFATTRADVQVSPISDDTLWVSTNGSGHLYTKDFPGNIETLFNTNDNLLLNCGTTLFCKGGTYYVGNFEYRINYATRPCNDESKPIVITSDWEDPAVFDGSDTARSTWSAWTLNDAANGIYTATLNPQDGFSTLLKFDGQRLFPYATRYTAQIPGYYRECLANLWFGSGFYRDKNQFYIKMKNGENPNGHTITVSKQNRFLFVNKYGTPNANPRFIFKNLKFRNYGKAEVEYYYLFSILNFTRIDPALVLHIKSISGTIVDNCDFDFCSSPLYFNGVCDTTTIQNCHFYDQTGAWAHGQFKNTSLFPIHGDINLLNDPGKAGRDLEKSFLMFDSEAGAKNIIVRNNTFDGYVNAMGGISVDPIYDVDVYNNLVKNNYDAVDGFGNAVNTRVWGNRITNNPVNFSLITYPLGPIYIFRNQIDNLAARWNLKNLPDSFNPEVYVNYNDCDGVQQKTWGSLLKMNTSEIVTNKITDIHFYHNTVVSKDTLAFNFYLGPQNWRSIHSANNIFYSAFRNVFFDGVDNEPTYAFKSVSDNYFSAHGLLGLVNPTHGPSHRCVYSDNLDSLSAHIRQISGNQDSSSLDISGFMFEPQFVNYANDDYHLANPSPCINIGINIPNISDLPNVNYFGNAPDVGAYETQVVNGVFQNKNQTLSLFPNPNNGVFLLKTTQPITSYTIYDNNGRLLQSTSLDNQMELLEISCKQLSNGIYFLKTIFSDQSFGTIAFSIHQ